MQQSSCWPGHNHLVVHKPVEKMLIRKPPPIRSSEITSQSVWKERRRFVKQATALGLSLGAKAKVSLAAATMLGGHRDSIIRDVRATAYGGGLKPTPYDDILSYTNFYEFGSDKGDATGNADVLNTRPWTIRIDGECEKPGEIGFEDLIADFAQEERIYRFRCVEAWSMIVPWVGFPLGKLLKRFEPTSKARYVALETLYDPDTMTSMLDGPYQEGLRMDEAMHPLTLLATGLYGEFLLPQNGAPLRLVVPWKYGFKSIKSIVRISFVEHMPDTTWPQLGPSEYGFYANVNPNVDHPRWSQRRHQVIGEGLFSDKQETLMFNGYADEVASLYRGMDLKVNY